MNRTNAPGTCLYCGTKLRPYERWQEIPLAAAEAEALHAAWRKHPRKTRFQGRRIASVRRPGGSVMHPSVAVYVPHGTGYDGNGYFHSGECAKRFAAAAAIGGVRLVAFTQEED